MVAQTLSLVANGNSAKIPGAFYADTVQTPGLRCPVGTGFVPHHRLHEFGCLVLLADLISFAFKVLEAVCAAQAGEA